MNMICRRQMAVAVSVVLTGMLIRVTPAPAGVLANVATESTQLLNYAQLLAHYIRQGEQLTQEIRQLEEMVRNGKALPNQIFGSVIADLNQLAAIVQGGRALAYSMANLDSEFRSRFPGYGYTAGTYYQNYRVWSQTTLDTTLSTLRAAGLQGQQLQSEQSVLAALRTMAMSADGRMQAIEVGNQISEQTVEQLMKLRQLMLVDLQSKQAFQAAQIQNEARGHAATEQFFNYVAPVRDGETFSGGSR
jgi:P-type conjugative transfer protein TrbJ